MKTLQELHDRRLELIEYIITKDLMKEIHYMRFLELQDVNFEIIKLEPDYDYTNTTEKEVRFKQLSPKE